MQHQIGTPPAPKVLWAPSCWAGMGRTYSHRSSPAGGCPQTRTMHGKARGRRAASLGSPTCQDNLQPVWAGRTRVVGPSCCTERSSTACSPWISRLEPPETWTNVVVGENWRFRNAVKFPFLTKHEGGGRSRTLSIVFSCEQRGGSYAESTVVLLPAPRHASSSLGRLEVK